MIKNKKRIEQDMSVKINGNKVGLPRYYRNKLELNSDLLFELGQKNSCYSEEVKKELIAVKTRARLGIINDKELVPKLESIYKAIEKNYKAKEKLFGKD